MKTIKNFARYLVENGLLFEINRQVLNPLGLHLDADVDSNNRSKLILNRLLDSEDDEGFVYDEESFSENMKKFNDYLSRGGQEKIERRKEKLGFIIQEK